jgi:hypothetical protein
MTWLDDNNIELGGNLSRFQIELCFVLLMMHLRLSSCLMQIFLIGT